jgi:sulfur-oxidizing protein SoxY
MRVSHLIAVLMALGAAVIGPGFSNTAARAEDEPWLEIRQSLFGDRSIADDGSVKIFAPKRAEDAAIVPVRVYIGGDRIPKARALTLLVDHNPAPVAAVFHFGDLYRAGNIGDRSLEVRLRLENMSRVRAVLETVDGELIEASQFVAGAGGCTSTSLKNMDEALRGIGRVKLRVEDDATRGDLWRELQVQIRHPNFSGMQIDTATNAFTPAEFVDRVTINIGAERLVTVDSGIAISEDPNFRLTFANAKPADIKLMASDTAGRKFTSHLE